MLTSTAPCALVPEVQLDLLECPLDQERRVGVHDRPQPGQRQPAADADHELLPDAHVEHPLRMPAVALANRSAEISASTTAASGSSSSNAKRRREKTVRMSVMTFPPPWPRPARPPVTARLERRVQLGVVAPFTRVTDQPATAKCASIPPGPQPQEDDWLSTATTVRFGSPAAPAYTMASLLLPSSSSASPTRTNTRGARPPTAGSPRAISPCASPPRSAARDPATRWRSPRPVPGCGPGDSPAASRPTRIRPATTPG